MEVDDSGGGAMVNVPYASGSQTERFEFGSSGWWSPTLRDQGFQSQIDDASNMADGVKNFFRRNEAARLGVPYPGDQ
jgi:hypothetical protein